MTSPDRPRIRHPWRLLAALAVAGVAVAAVAIGRPWTPAPVVAAADGRQPVAAAAPAPLHLPEHPHVLVFGDSWTWGAAADLPTDGYAYLIGRDLGWETTVDGVRGSGYLKRGFLEPGVDGGTFGERIARLDPDLDPDLVIIEGSINDRRAPEAGYRGAVTRAWNALAALYPKASFVVMGPAPQILPVESGTARIDRDLSALAAHRGWWYVSPVEQHWITTRNWSWVIDAAANNHPSTRGHEYLAEKLTEALQSMGDRKVIADAPHTDLEP
ncbi:SGNH/GDSL hydrolase family protein [Microbacterium sp.]|uniref:SGNH/GDSL hydrolase family protein n=1 Tax=Microbacterium sp. TaxID=51671 RepID=UPI0025F1D693|nr:SGNH/GDSL hydrolase family protein [Microbacterium sp.]